MISIGRVSTSKAARRRGDTLIEVIFSLAILSSLLVIALSGALLAWRTSLDAAYRSQATYIAERQAQALKAYADSLGWQQFTVAGSSPDLSIAQFGGIGAACGVTPNPPCVPVGSNPQFFMTVANLNCPNGNWAVSSGTQTEVLSSSSLVNLPPCAPTATPSTQSTLSSTYTVGIYVHDVSSLNTLPASTAALTTLRFDITVTWPSLIRHAASSPPNIVNEVEYINQPTSL